MKRQIRRWGFPTKRNQLWGDEYFIEKVTSLYRRNYNTKRLLRALEIDGYNISARQLQEFRLHPSIRLLLGTARNRREEADRVADEAISGQINSGQALNYGAGYMQASLRLQGIFVSGYV